MQRLCTKCASLSLAEQDDILIEDLSINHTKTRVVCDRFQDNLQELMDSARGANGNKECDLCALLFWSWNYAQPSEQSDQCAFRLMLRSNEDCLSILLRCGLQDGHPIKVTVDSFEPLRGYEVSTSACSDEAFTTIRAWVRNCEDNHKRCQNKPLRILGSPRVHNNSKARQSSGESWLPSRVIEVGSVFDSPKLLESCGMHGKYITLSHRWTRQTALSSTTKSNLEDRKRAIDTSELSQIFQDAIDLTQELGVPYLWIDSLCIVQDCKDDWRRESGNMMAIYESAWLNIAAAGSDRETGRLYMERIPALNRVCRLPASFRPGSARSMENSKEESSTWAYIDPLWYLKSVLNGFLDQRGWVFQERVLSARTVFFAANELVWECNELLASETLRWRLGSSDECSSWLMKFNSGNGAPTADSLFNSWHERRYNDPLLGRPGLCSGGAVAQNLLAYQYWYKSLELFSLKDLTTVSDKLPAIYGIARALHKSRLLGKPFSQCYRQGIWLDDLAHSLLWYSPSQSCGSQETVPSFSWASCLGEIKFLGTSL
ncbi:heterokaryon incompatibility protein, partial [Hyaloscypha variabilis]